MDDRRGIVAKIVLEHSNDLRRQTRADDAQRRLRAAGRAPQLAVARPPGPRRVPAPLLAEVQRRRRRDVPRASRDRDLQLVVGARQLQRAPARPGRGGQARRPAGRRLPARVPGHVARRVADEADDDALPQPDGDGRRGVDPLLPARRRRPADRLRQDEPRLDHGRVLGEHPDDRRHGRADAQRPLARQGARLLLGLLALPRGAARAAASASRTSPRSRTRCRAPTATA